MIDKQEIEILNSALDVKIAALKRAANTEKNEEIKRIREKEIAQCNNLQAKINTKGLFDETPISKQK